MIRSFIAYSSKDLTFKEEIRKRLQPLQRAGKVEIWDNYNIEAGKEWDVEVREKLEHSDIILLLISPDALVDVLVAKIESTRIKSRILEKDQLEKQVAQVVSDKIILGYESRMNELEVKSKNDPFSNQMVMVKGGKFDMGGTFYGEGKPIHQVKVLGFYISKYLVTKAQWAKVMGDSSRVYNPNSPAGKVSWLEVQDFIKRLNQQTNKQYRLPTEAEWEYAARGGNRSKRYEFAGSNNLDDVGWFTGNTDKIQRIGIKDPNEIGLYDMCGNVWEWCEDLWHMDYKGAPSNSNPWLSGGVNDTRVVRGGSIGATAASCRIGIGDGEKIKKNAIDIGFRLAHT